jgi:hypothetical protein
LLTLPAYTKAPKSQWCRIGFEGTKAEQDEAEEEEKEMRE